MKYKKELIWIGIIIGIYMLVEYLAPLTARAWGGDSRPMRLLIYYAWYLIPAVVVIAIADGIRAVWKQLGLTGKLTEGLLWGFLFTLPMLIGYAITGSLNTEMTLMAAISGSLLPAFFEELFFRGFVFGQLFYRVKWGFIPAAGINAIIFGLGHIWQGNSLGESLGVFAVTFMGAAWFAWLYVEWKGNLWVPITLHLLMNFYWGLFDVDENALGGVWANVFRGMVIAISIYVTIRRNKPLSITGKHLIRNSAVDDRFPEAQAS